MKNGKHAEGKASFEEDFQLLSGELTIVPPLHGQFSTK